jgi:hypothetical protein
MINNQNNHKEKLAGESGIDEISILKSVTRQIESLVPIVTEDTRKLIPRHQNQMVAEATKDMYFSGLMSE